MTAHAVDRPCRCAQHWCAICGTDLDPDTWAQHVCEPTGPRPGSFGEEHIDDRELGRWLREPTVPAKPARRSLLDRLLSWWPAWRSWP